jgi:hypothetical protein
MSCIDNWDSLNSGEQMACLKTTIGELKTEIKGMTREASNFSSQLGSSGNIFKDMLVTVKDMQVRMVKFTGDFKAQYQLGEKIAQSYKKTALQIGLSVGRSKDLSDEFKGAVANVANFGGELSDVESIYSDFADASGRARIMDKDDVSNIYKLSQAANLYGSEATNLYETLDLMGVSNQSATQRMTDLIKDSQKIGLNSSKVMKVLSSNMKQMQSYSFRDGVKGMTEMAKLGVKLRMEVSDMLGMADKFYEPEAAIESVANLQMLGGDVADAFGDPFEIMYLARNKPEELAKKMQDMTENMMTFNEETKEYEFPAEARMQLKAAGEQLGINTDNMIEMARQTSKMKDVKDKLSIGGMFSDEEMDGIASMSRLEDGEFKVDFRNKDGDKVTKSLDELKKGDYEMLLKPPANEKDYQGDMLYNAQTTNEHLQNIEDAFQKRFISKVVDPYEVTENTTKGGIDATERMFKDMSDAASKQGSKYLGKLFEDVDGNLDEWSKELGDKIEKEIDKLNIFDEEGIDMSNSDMLVNKLSKLVVYGVDDTVTDKKGEVDHTVTEKKSDVASMGGNRVLSGGFGSFSLDNRDLVIAGKPQNLLGGSGGGDTIKVEPITMTINGDLTLNAPNGSTNIDLDMESIKGVVTKMITDSLNGANYSGGKVGSSLNTA